MEPFEKKVWLSSPTMHGDELKYMKEAYDTNWMSTVGKNIDESERMISEITGAKYAVGLSSGTAALHLAMRLAAVDAYPDEKPSNGGGLLHGHGVFCSDMTFDASVNPVVYEGGTPIFIDSEYETWNMDPKALQKAVEMYPDVKILVFAHLYGTPAKIDEIMKICDELGIIVVEDAAESLGSVYKTKRVTEGSDDIKTKHTSQAGGLSGSENQYKGGYRQTGTFGKYNAISFNGNKIITGSSGGMLLTDIKEAADKARKWSTQSREAAPWYQHEELGYNYRMSNVIAGVIRGQIPYLQEHIAQKTAIYERYRKGLQNLPVRMNPYDTDRSVPNHWLSCLIIDEDAMEPQVRGENKALYESQPGRSCPTHILEDIASINAEGRPIWKPMHMQPIYRNNAFITRFGSGRARTNAYIEGGMLGADGRPLDIGMDIFARGLCLPSDNKMTEEQQDRIIEVIKRAFE